MSCDCACELCIGHKGGHSEWQLSDQIYTDSRSGSRITVHNHIFGIWRRCVMGHGSCTRAPPPVGTRKLTPRGADIALFAEFGVFVLGNFACR